MSSTLAVALDSVRIHAVSQSMQELAPPHRRTAVLSLFRSGLAHTGVALRGCAGDSLAHISQEVLTTFKSFATPLRLLRAIIARWDAPALPPQYIYWDDARPYARPDAAPLDDQTIQVSIAAFRTRRAPPPHLRQKWALPCHI